MKRYRVENTTTGEAFSLTVEEAEALSQVDRHEIEWAIEEEGVCETDEFVITEYEAALALHSAA